MISIGMTGATVIGDVLDVNKEPLERAIKAYDAQLYLKWNPKKRNGHGIWELRRRPEQKSVVELYEIGGMRIFRLEYQELGIVNHIFDVPYLNYDLLTRIKKADTWVKADYDGTNTNKTHQLLNTIEAKRIELEDKRNTNQYNDLIYNMKQNKTALRAYKEAILSGTNPADIARYWDK